MFAIERLCIAEIQTAMYVFDNFDFKADKPKRLMEILGIYLYLFSRTNLIVGRDNLIIRSYL